MPTNKARINITLPEYTRTALIKLARRDGMPQATKAASLLETALEMEEDMVWDTLAKRRDTKNAQFVSDDKAWK